jgi:hypothetical protein
VVTALLLGIVSVIGI